VNVGSFATPHAEWLYSVVLGSGALALDARVSISSSNSPTGASASKVNAEFSKGVLRVRIPKNAEVKPAGRKVEIKSV